MFWMRLILSLAEFLLCVVLSVFVVFWSYKSFVKTAVDYDAEEEIRRGNVAVAVLLAALMGGAALILQQCIYPVIGILTLGLADSSGYGLGWLAAFALGHLLLGFLLSVGGVETGLRLFAALNRDLDDGEQIRRGNVAVAVIIAAVVLILSMFMQRAASSLSKSLIPQPRLGAIEVIR